MQSESKECKIFELFMHMNRVHPIALLEIVIEKETEQI